MVTIKLIHPELGLVGIKRLSESTDRYVQIRSWKYKYGKKFHECEVKIEFPEKEDKFTSSTPNHLRKLINNCTGEVYENQKEAAKALNLSEKTIRLHLKRKLKGRFEYLVRYAD